MIANDPFRQAMRQRPLYATVSHLVAASRRMRRRRDKRAKRNSLLGLFSRLPPLDDNPAADPVKVAVLAIDIVGRASVRACFTGTAIDVAAPDEATASVLRAALAETTRVRATDQLIRITVA